MCNWYKTLWGSFSDIKATKYLWLTFSPTASKLRNGIKTLCQTPNLVSSSRKVRKAAVVGIDNQSGSSQIYASIHQPPHCSCCLTTGTQKWHLGLLLLISILGNSTCQWENNGPYQWMRQIDLKIPAISRHPHQMEQSLIGVA